MNIYLLAREQYVQIIVLEMVGLFSISGKKQKLSKI
jgi:hypothetical protein